MKNETVAKNLNILQGKMKLREFAAKIGIGQSTLHNYLKGRDSKGLFLKDVCVKTGCDANWLLGVVPIDSGDKLSAIKVSALTMHIQAQIEENQRFLASMNVRLTVTESQCKTCKFTCPHTSDDVVISGCLSYVDA